MARQVLALGLGSAGVVLVGPAAQAVDGADCTSINAIDTTGPAATDVSEPLEELQIRRAHELVREASGREPGEGVTVAVLDSGVQALPQLPEVAEDRVPEFSKSPAYSWYHGTAMAGIIAGAARREDRPVGIAPAAQIYDQRVYDTGEDNDELAQVTTDGVVAGLDRLRPLVGPSGIRIVTVALSVEESPALEAAVKRVTEAGAIVVAASGNRTGEGDDYLPGEDYAEAVWPAGYAKNDRNRRVVAAGSTVPLGESAVGFVLQNSAIDVAVPTYGAVSYAINRSTCAFYSPSTSVAAATVSGVLALLWTVYPDENPDQIIARLEVTASGGGTFDAEHPDKLVGRGVIQPLEALQRAIQPDRKGRIPRSDDPERAATPAVLPTPEPDVLASTRDNAIWWGLVGGGALLVAVLLRPVLARGRDRA